MLSGMVVGMGGYGSGVAQPDPNLSKHARQAADDLGVK